MTDNITSEATLENGEIYNKLKPIDIKFHFNCDKLKK